MSEKKLKEVVRDSLNGREPETRRSIAGEIGSWISIIAVAMLIAILLTRFIVVNAKVTSGSMETTIMTGDRLIGLRTSYWFSDPQRGDVVFFYSPDNESEIFVKRVIGVPGDVVEIKSGVTYVNGEALSETYLRETPAVQDFGPYEVPEGCYFMMGDNRNNSNDSRYWQHTYVERSKILGKAEWIYYPRFEKVDNVSE